MASLRSIGAHKSVALPFLIAEGILDNDSTQRDFIDDVNERDYVCDTYSDESGNEPIDEVVTTAYHVVWARGGVVHKLFNFEIEGQRVKQALVTWFPIDVPLTSSMTPGLAPEYSSNDQSKSFLTQGTQPATDPNAPVDNAPSLTEVRSRALVVFLKSHAHVFFLSGTMHIVNLPFEVDRAFPAARGVVLQRRLAPLRTVPASPHVPSAPPNSFVTNTQSFVGYSFSQGLAQQGRRHGSSSLGPSRAAAGGKARQSLFLEDLALSTAGAVVDAMPRVYSFTDPLSELGLVVGVVASGERASLLTTQGSGHRRFEAIDKAEEVLYVSPRNEVLFDRTGNDKPLLLVVTANHETNVFTIWTAAYMEPKSISASRKRIATLPISKSRRRSSYGATAPGTGTTTPAIRGGDRVRESFGGAARSKTHPPSFKEATQTKERLSDQAVEDALASQLNPDAEALRPPKESRRVSGLLSRAELSTSFDKNAFQDLATQRTSLGGSFSASFGASQRTRYSLGHDRTSFGHSQSRYRASTPGSATSRMSLGGASIDDTFEDAMMEDMMEDFDELDDLFAPPEAGAEPQPGDGLHKELVMTVVEELNATQYLKSGLFALRDPSTESRTQAKIIVLNAPFNSATLHERKIYLYISHSSLESPLECELSVTRKRLSPSASTTQGKSISVAPRYACMPRLVTIRSLPNHIDLVKLHDGHIERIATLVSTDPQQPCLALTVGWSSPLSTTFHLGPLRLFDPYAIQQHKRTRAAAGLKRTIHASQPLQQLSASGPQGQLEVVDGDVRRHRVELRLSPEDRLVADLFHALRTVLPNYGGDSLLQTWWCIRKQLAGTAPIYNNPDWTAFVATLFTLAMPFVDEKDNKTPRRPRGDTRQNTLHSRSCSKDADEEGSAWTLMCARQASRPSAKSCDAQPWAWALKATSAAAAMSPPSKRPSSLNATSIAQQIRAKDQSLLTCIEIARQFNQSHMGKAMSDHWRKSSPSEKQDLRISTLAEILVTLHLVREERKLDILQADFTEVQTSNLAPVLAQLGYWLRWEGWSWSEGSFYELNGGSSLHWAFEDSSFTSKVKLHAQPWDTPPSIMEWLGAVVGSHHYEPFPTLAMLIRKSKASPHSSINIDEIVGSVTPRTMALHNFFRDVDPLSGPAKVVELVDKSGITINMLATLPETAKAPLMEAITSCQANPPTTWSSSLLKLVQREDLDLNLTSSGEHFHDTVPLTSASATRDIHSICMSVETVQPLQSSAEVDRHYITRLIFREDRRFAEAFMLLEPLRQANAEYKSDGDDAAILEGQKTLMQWVMIRTFSLPSGSSMIKFSSKKPLLTEKYNVFGFSTSCLMKPLGNVVTADRQQYSEEKYCWAFFNAGVSAGLSISRDAQGIDTSWIMYNKPHELSNRHAGLLLGLGLNGHLRTIAKWLSFKYLTPKHTMTSVGLLLGLAASFMGTMDTLVTRLLSVHVTRMLPPGAAELNLSPYTQTTGLMGIGLLYYNTQHRRMSEVMLSEIEHVDVPDPSEPPDTLRDEAYRLAAGFALGFINLGKGKDLRGLHDMKIVERLMTVAVAPKPVSIVHIRDQATPGAIIAIALIFMKTHDRALARTIDVPDTLPQFDYVRPDTFLLRTLAKHIIMWDDITATEEWVIANLPHEYRDDHALKHITKLRSEQMAFYNILAGLLWAVSLKYAGTGDVYVRTFLLKYLDQFIRITRLTALRYDAKLARNTVRNCQDLVALAAATVMAGTGDLDVFRRLRGLHARVGPDIPYGSHLAAHMAVGALFLAGGTQTFSRENKAIAALICAFYPLFPLDVQDSRAHLQAFRHFWVLAAEPRCLVVRDVESGRAIPMNVTVYLKPPSPNPTTTTTATIPLIEHYPSALPTKLNLAAPALLPPLPTISHLTTTDPTYWPLTLDPAHNATHRRAFARSQTLLVRRRTAGDAAQTTFSATLMALNDALAQRAASRLLTWILSRPALAPWVGRAEAAALLPGDSQAAGFSAALGDREGVVEARLVLRRVVESVKVEELRDLRGVLGWGERVLGSGGRLSWVGSEVLGALGRGVAERAGRVGGVSA